ncbi:hypothetical protein YPPY06_0706, partial [Yersinia pestis PY-06]
MYPASGGGG